MPVSSTKSKIKKRPSAVPLIKGNTPFEVGDQVIHPRHGLGKVTKMVIKQFVEGEKRLFYEVSFTGSTLWVPLNFSTSGIRKLAVKSEISSCRRLLIATPVPLKADLRIRQTELNDRLKEGTLTANCEVVRDLTAYGWQKTLSGSFVTFLNMAQDVLCQEWAAVEEITVTEAVVEVTSLLEKGRRANDNG